MALLKTNTGIGTTNPTSALHVIGDGLVTGVVTATSFSGNINSGVATVTNLTATNSTLTNINSSGITTLGVTTVTRLTTQSTFTSGITTSVGGFVGNLTGTATTATKLETARTFEITGDIVASPITFDGTGNVSLAATIQPNSVGLGTDTFGDYVRNISGTANQITVTGGTGEGSTPVISFAPNPLIGGNVTIGNDLQVNNNLNVTGNITVGGTEGYILVESFRISDADIVLGFATDSQGNDVSTDTTANHGGIAIASTEGTPIITITNPGVGETLPATYKKFMWFKAGSFAGLNTDAWLSNYAIGIGSTQFPSGTRLAAGSVQITENDLAVVRNINASGIVTGSTFRPSSGYIQSPNGTNSFYIYDGTGNVAFQGTIGASQVNNASGFKVIGFAGTDITFENDARIGNNAYIAGVTTSIGGFIGNLTGTASTASFATTAFSLNGVVERDLRVAFAQTAGITTNATNVSGGTASVTQLSVSGVTTLSSVGASQIYVSGVTTSVGGFVGNLTGTATTATNLSDAANIADGILNSARLSGTYNININGNATTASNAGISTNIKGGAAGNIPYQSAANTTTFLDASTASVGQVILWNGNIPYWGNVSAATGAFGGITVQDEGTPVGTANSITTLNIVSPNLVVTGTSGANGIATVRMSDNLVGTALSISGISTIANLRVTPVGTGATVGGIGVTYFGDGSQLSGVSAGVSISTNTTNQNQLIPFAISTGTITGLGITASGLVFNPSTTRLGIGTTNPLQNLHIQGNLLVAAGSDTTQHITQRAYELEGGSLSWEGTAGQLFSITNNLTSGPIFSVNDVSGIPSIEVTADGTIELAPFADGNVGIATTRPTSRLHVVGDALVVGVVTATTFSGNATSSTYATTAGIATYATTAGIATYATTSGVSTSVIGGIASVTQLSVSGVSTVGFITATNLNVSGVGTFQSSGLKIRNPANTFGYTITGGAIAADRDLNLPVITGIDTVAVLGLSQTFTGTQTFSGAVTVTGTVNLTGTAAGISHRFATNQTTSTLTLGGTSGTGLIIFGQSTASQQTDIQAGASGVGTTKTINLGTGGLSGSFTQINIGPGPSAGVGTITVNTGTNLGIGSATPTAALDVIGNVRISSNLNVTGISTLGTVRISSGIITATSGVVTYFGDGSQLSGISAGLSITDDTSTNATRYILFDDVTSGTITGANVSSTKLTFNPSTGNLVAGGTVTANSDERLKENVKTIENALDKVLSLRGVEFDRIDTGDHQIGVIAQEVEKIIPDVVYPKQPAPDYETKSVAYANLVGLLIEAVKEQNRRIDELERRLEGN